MRIHVFGLLMNWDRAAKGDGGWSQLYRAAIQRVAPGAEVTFESAPFGQGGSFYEAYGRAHPLVRPAGVDCLVVLSWSAGYGAIRTWGRDGLLECDVLATLDSGYASTGADGRPLPEHVDPWTRIARAAIAGGLAWVSGASDVPTHPGPDATLPTTPGYSSFGGYESTRELTAAVAASVQLEMEPRPGPLVVAEAHAGSLLLRYYDGVPGDRGTAEHVAAVHGWGPELVAEGVRMWALGRSGATYASEPPATLPTGASPHLIVPTSSLADVREVQVAAFCASSPLAQGRPEAKRPADGVWGPATRRALECFQRSAGLPLRNAFGAEERAARAAMPLVLDVSHHQPPIDWARVRKAGFAAVIIRASYGATPDARDATHAAGAREHWDGAGAAGLGRVGYLFLRPGLPVAAQVSAAVATLPDARGWWVDVEPDPLSPSARHTRDEVELAHRMLSATAKRTGDYSAKFWWDDTCHLGPTTRPVWCAGPNLDRLHGSADRALLVQPETRLVPGVTGAVDVNVWLAPAELAEWCV